MEDKTFKENLQRKIQMEKLASKVIASIGTAQTPRHIDNEAMRSLLELSPYRHRHERDLDLYIKDEEGELKNILVLDNELPIFHSTVKDVVVRRSPKTLEMWKISTIRHILVDSDIKVSTGEESVHRVLGDAIDMLDLAFTAKDIENLAREGMAWLAGAEAEGVEEILELFAALLEYRKPPKYLGLDQTVSYGTAVTGSNKEVVFGPLVLYRPAANNLIWLDRSFSRTDRQQLEFLRSAAAGRKSVALTGDAVFEKLMANVLTHPERVRASLKDRTKE